MGQGLCALVCFTAFFNVLHVWLVYWRFFPLCADFACVCTARITLSPAADLLAQFVELTPCVIFADPQGWFSGTGWAFCWGSLIPLHVGVFILPLYSVWLQLSRYSVTWSWDYILWFLLAIHWFIGGPACLYCRLWLLYFGWRVVLFPLLSAVALSY